MASLLDMLFGRTPMATQGGEVIGPVTEPQGGLLGNLRNSSGSLLGFGMGMLSGANQQEGFGNAMTGMQRGVLTDRQRKAMQEAQMERLQTQRARQTAASKLGIDPDIAAADPDIIGRVAADKYAKPSQSAAYKALVEAGYKPGTPEFTQAMRKTLGLTEGTTIKEFDPEKQYMQVGPDGKMTPIPGLGGGQKKAPANYRWNAEGTALEPIPGGPADPANSKDNVMPAEVAGRIALAETYLKNAPNIRKKIKAGEATGLIDATMGQMGIGEQGSLYGDIESGVDALRRGLTGAGMAESEADAYARRYLPTRKDDYQTMLHKHDKLVTELQAIRLKQYEGRKKGVQEIPQTGTDSEGGAQPNKRRLLLLEEAKRRGLVK